MTGPELRAALRELGLTQAEFSSLTGVRRETISHRCCDDPRYPIPQSDETIIRLIRGETIDAILNSTRAPDARTRGGTSS